MKINYTTLKAIINSYKEIKCDSPNITVIGNLLLPRDSGIIDLGYTEINIKVTNSKIIVKGLEELVPLSERMNISNIEEVLVLNSMGFLTNVEFMDTKVEGYSDYERWLTEVLTLIMKHYKCRCLDVLYYIKTSKPSSMKIFDDGCVSKTYTYKKESGRNHMNVVDCSFRQFISDYPYHKIISIQPNYETPNTEINFKQQVKDCVKNNMTYNYIRKYKGGADGC